MCMTSLKNNNYECFKYIYETYNPNLIVESNTICKHRNIEMLKYLHQKELIIDNQLSHELSSSCANDFEFIVYFVDNKLPGYEKFITENFIYNLNKRLSWGVNNYELFLSSSFFNNKLTLNNKISK